MWPLTRSRPEFEFLSPLPLIDNDLELIEPGEQYIDDVLAACGHPLTIAHAPEMARTTAYGLQNFLDAAPMGHHAAKSKPDNVPSYHFWMRLNGESPPVRMAGTIGLRIGVNRNLTHYVGHIGYNVYPPARGNHLAERASRLLFPLARRHGLNELWITCNPENHASRRTCERLGAKLIGVVEVPADHDLYARGEVRKCRYHISL